MLLTCGIAQHLYRPGNTNRVVDLPSVRTDLCLLEESDCGLVLYLLNKQESAGYPSPIAFNTADQTATAFRPSMHIHCIKWTTSCRQKASTNAVWTYFNLAKDVYHKARIPFVLECFFFRNNWLLTAVLFHANRSHASCFVSVQEHSLIL